MQIYHMYQIISVTMVDTIMFIAYIYYWGTQGNIHIFTGKTTKLFFLYRGLGLQLQIRASLKNKF